MQVNSVCFDGTLTLLLTFTFLLCDVKVMIQFFLKKKLWYNCVVQIYNSYGHVVLRKQYRFSSNTAVWCYGNDFSLSQVHLYGVMVMKQDFNRLF